MELRYLHIYSISLLLLQGAASLMCFFPSEIQQVMLLLQVLGMAYEAVYLPGHPETTLASHPGPCSAQTIWKLWLLPSPPIALGTASGVSALVKPGTEDLATLSHSILLQSQCKGNLWARLARWKFHSLSVLQKQVKLKIPLIFYIQSWSSCGLANPFLYFCLMWVSVLTIYKHVASMNTQLAWVSYSSSGKANSSRFWL